MHDPHKSPLGDARCIVLGPHSPYELTATYDVQIRSPNVECRRQIIDKLWARKLIIKHMVKVKVSYPVDCRLRFK
jgi:hypothetical protein